MPRSQRDAPAWKGRGIFIPEGNHLSTTLGLGYARVTSLPSLPAPRQHQAPQGEPYQKEPRAG